MWQIYVMICNDSALNARLELFLGAEYNEIILGVVDTLFTSKPNNWCLLLKKFIF